MAGNPLTLITGWIDTRIQLAIVSAINVLMTPDNQAKLKALFGSVVHEAVSSAVTPLAQSVDAFPGAVEKAVASFPADVGASVNKAIGPEVSAMQQAVQALTSLPQNVSQAIAGAFSNIHIPGIPNIFGEHQEIVVRHRGTGEERIIKEPEDLK